MVQFDGQNAYFVTKILVRFFVNFTFRALGVEGPRGGAINVKNRMFGNRVMSISLLYRNRLWDAKLDETTICLAFVCVWKGHADANLRFSILLRNEF